MNGLIYMYNPTTISGIIRHTIITNINIRYLLFSLIARSGLIIYATFLITQSPYFFLNFWRRLSDLRLVCSLGYIDGVYLFHAFITVFTHHLFFTSWLWLSRILWKQNKRCKKQNQLLCKQIVLSVSVTLMVAIWDKWLSPWQRKQLPGSQASPIK